MYVMFCSSLLDLHHRVSRPPAAIPQPVAYPQFNIKMLMPQMLPLHQRKLINIVSYQESSGGSSGLRVTVLISGLCSWGLSPDWGHYVVYLCTNVAEVAVSGVKVPFCHFILKKPDRCASAIITWVSLSYHHFLVD